MALWLNDARLRNQLAFCSPLWSFYTVHLLIKDTLLLQFPTFAISQPTNIKCAISMVNVNMPIL
jgi:hypothetical protein